MYGKTHGHHGWQHHWHRPPMMHGGKCGWGFRPWLPLLFLFGFAFFALPKLAFLLPFLVIGGALWWMMSPNARRWGHGAWERMEQEWSEKPKRDGESEDKPKRDNYI